jgi:hypothetical protein
MIPAAMKTWVASTTPAMAPTWRGVQPVAFPTVAHSVDAKRIGTSQAITASREAEAPNPAP